MRVTAFAVSSLLGTAMVVATVFALGDEARPPASALVLVSVVVVWAVGLFSGIVIAGDWWDPATPDGSRDHRRFLVVAIVVAVLAAGLLGAQVATDAVSVGAASGSAVAGLGYIALNLAVATWVRRREEIARTRGIDEPEHGWIQVLTRHRADNVALWFAIVLVVGVGVAVLVDELLLLDAQRVLFPVSIAVSLAALVATIMCSTIAMNLYGPTRDLLGSDRERNRRIRRVVLGGRDIELSEEESELATAYAPLAAEATAWNLAQNVFLFTALLTQNIPRLAEPVPLGLSIVLVAAVAIAIPFSLRQVERARRYAATPAAA
ncbi:hypothetical protein ELQ90_02620 [Labedella phragmitis]|uniref:Uncharacterized protein n=1 Tax=Labedella phragmitis TaxID=2498849 RepID=A0A444PYD5_9MICO|nr:hypothetical protein [Labedella phragmitis]RWZ52853.1 hypothetical protein ELQ90_02620 [Labedella phragmitis]